MCDRLLEVINVTKNYGNLVALKDVSFSVQKGEIFGLIGSNGAGKSTLVNLISGFIPCSTGDIHFLGKSIRDLKPHQISNLGISRTFQDVQSFTNMTTLENVMGGKLFGKKGRGKTVREAREKSIEILDLLGLAAKKDMPSASLNNPERKRLEMARALAMDPMLLVLDEVTDGLNSAEIGELIKLIKRIRESGITIMLIEHVMKAITNVSDRVLVLNQGEKIAEGTINAILNNRQVIDHYLGRRYRGHQGIE